MENDDYLTLYRKTEDDTFELYGLIYDLDTHVLKPDDCPSLMTKFQGWTFYNYKIDPNWASLLAATRIFETELQKHILHASEFRPQHSEPLNEEQLEAFENLKKVLGDKAYYLHSPSIVDSTREGLKFLQERVKELHEHPMVKEAFEQYVTVLELAKASESGK